MFVFLRLIADIQKKGKLASLNIILLFCGCKTAHRKFMFVADFACTALLHLGMQLSLQVWPCSVKW